MNETPQTPPGSERVSDQSVRDKIRSITELGEIAEQARAAGKKVALAHGVFDLVHMGHVRYLEGARAEGGLLIVTTTADEMVNRGPGRPIFPEDLRAEMLAALQYVDWVGISHASSAENVLDTIKPDFYVKGSDYENPEDDVTGKIVEERKTVEKHGGRLVFTKDITFSSSALINRYLDVYDRPLQDHLEKMRQDGAEEKLAELVESVKDFKVLLVGDAIIDEYLYVKAVGKAAKENIIATRFQNSETFAGGIFAAANHVASFCAEVEIITSLGRDDSFEDLIRSNLLPNVKLTVVYRDGVPTTRKTSFIDPSYMRKLFEVYTFDDSPLAPDLESGLNELVAGKASDFDLVIATDFGHGLISSSTIDVLVNKSRFLAVNTQTNSANLGYNLITKYPKAGYICIDSPEAHLAAADRYSDTESVIVNDLSTIIDCGKIIVTHGDKGCITYDRDHGMTNIPAFTKSVVDTVGAGDAFLSVTAPLVAAGGTMDLVGFIGNAAGAMKVSIVGHRRSIEKAALLKYMTRLLK